MQAVASLRENDRLGRIAVADSVVPTDKALAQTCSVDGVGQIVVHTRVKAALSVSLQGIGDERDVVFPVASSALAEEGDIPELAKELGRINQRIRDLETDLRVALRMPEELQDLIPRVEVST